MGVGYKSGGGKTKHKVGWEDEQFSCLTKYVSTDQFWEDCQDTFAGMNEISSGSSRIQERRACLMISFGSCRQNVLYQNV